MKATTDRAQDHLCFKLSDDFVAPYENRPINWGFPCGGGNTLGELTYLTKYARLKEDGTRETWVDTCRRVTEGTFTILKNHCEQVRTRWNHNKAQKSAQDFFHRMFIFKWLPPGRGLWMMGTEFMFRTGSASLMNCFTGDTKFVTREGIRSLAESVNQVVQVWTGTGWASATVNRYGKKKVQRITFAPFGIRSNMRIVETATPDHRWILRDGTETVLLRTNDVVQGSHILPVLHPNTDAFLHGLVFGDGSIGYCYKNGDFDYNIQLCGNKAKYVGFFPHATYPPSKDGDPVAHLRSPKNLKQLPQDPTPEYAASFIAGWAVTDGSVKPSGAYSVATQDEGAARWLIDHAAMAGWSVTGCNIDSVQETNYGPRSSPCWRITITQEDVLWRVASIEELEAEEETFCATVPSAGMFTLASGLLTGNCAFLSTESLGLKNPVQAFTRLMEMSMLGVGVGFDTLGAGKLVVCEPSPDSSPIQFRIPDSREGWVESVDILLRQYLLPGGRPVVFDYDDVRPAGSLIRGFGGVASGPEPLRHLHQFIRVLFIGRDETQLTSTDIVDLMNSIGCCVRAGNVRRSAELALGLASDADFLDLKNPIKNPNRMGPGGWGGASNNSVIAEVGGDYSYLIDRIADNGEPGLIYLNLARRYGRLSDPPTERDKDVKGFNPCVEQQLEDGELCCLVETFPHHHETFEDYQQTLKQAYLFSKTVTLLTTHWPETNEVMNRNRRIGTSVSGIVQFAEARGWTELRRWMDLGFKTILDRDNVYSRWLGVRESVKHTTVKPSGTVSILAGATPGVHWPQERTYIRRQRFSAINPILRAFEQAGYHVEPDVMDPNDMVVEFPTQGPQVRPEKMVSVWEKCHLAALMQEWWSDNGVSATFTFRPDERDQVAPLLRAFDGKLKSMSFLPLSESGAYAQMPYEAISEAEFTARTALVKRIDFSSLQGEGEGEKFCTTDVCERVAPHTNGKVHHP